MKLGIYGGTFAPIHKAHINVAKAFYNEFALDKLLIIPTGIPPHKQAEDGDDPNARLEMCNLAFEGVEGIEVSDIELKRSGKSYTVMTLRELKSDDREIYFLCGTDMLMSFDRWYCFEEIFSLCTLVYTRREIDKDMDVAVENKLLEYRKKYNAKIMELKTNVIELSSTQIRDMIKDGKDASAFVPEKVLEYIKSNKLYGG